MDRNSIIGIILIGAILIMFTFFNKPSPQDLEQAQRIQDSIERVEQHNALQQVKNNSEKKQEILASFDSTLAPEKKDSILSEKYGAFAKAAIGNNEFYTIENDLLKLTLSSKGGRPYTVQLKNYKTHDSLPLILFNGDSTVFGFNFFAQNRLISTNELYFKNIDSLNTIAFNENDTAKSISLSIAIDDKKYIKYNYILKKGSYKVDYKIEMVGMSNLISQNTSTLDLNWELYSPGQEKGWKNENQYTGLYYKYFQDEVDNISETSSKTEEQNIPTRLKWVAYKQQFFSVVLISSDYFSNANVKQVPMPENNKYIKQFSSQLGVPFNSTNEINNFNLAFYFGPNHYQTLKKQGDELQELVFLGRNIIKWINRFLIIPIFNFLNGFILNYGLIILILTIIIKLLLFPLTYKSYLSMAKMRVLKPQIDEINEKIPAEKAMDRQQAVMALYRKVGVNPLGGCLPILLQMPILIAMFRFFPASIELRQQGFLWAHDLSTFDSIVSWDTYIPLITPYFGNHISLFNVLMTITTVITVHMSNKLQSSTQTLPGMKTMSYLMPIMFMFFLNSFSAGLTYYYFLANLITIIQNEVFRRSINEDKLLAKLNENKKKPVKKSSFQERLEKIAKERGYKMPKK